LLLVLSTQILKSIHRTMQVSLDELLDGEPGDMAGACRGEEEGEWAEEQAETPHRVPAHDGCKSRLAVYTE
jgi:hypothetical protein